MFGKLVVQAIFSLFLLVGVHGRSVVSQRDHLKHSEKDLKRALENAFSALFYADLALPGDQYEDAKEVKINKIDQKLDEEIEILKELLSERESKKTMRDDKKKEMNTIKKEISINNHGINDDGSIFAGAISRINSREESADVTVDNTLLNLLDLLKRSISENHRDEDHAVFEEKEIEEANNEINKEVALLQKSEKKEAENNKGEDFKEEKKELTCTGNKKECEERKSINLESLGTEKKQVAIETKLTGVNNAIEKKNIMIENVIKEDKQEAVFNMEAKGVVQEHAREAEEHAREAEKEKKELQNEAEKIVKNNINDESSGNKNEKKETVQESEKVDVKEINTNDREVENEIRISQEKIKKNVLEKTTADSESESKDEDTRVTSSENLNLEKKVSELLQKKALIENSKRILTEETAKKSTENQKNADGEEHNFAKFNDKKEKADSTANDNLVLLRSVLDEIQERKSRESQKERLRSAVYEVLKILKDKRSRITENDNEEYVHADSLM